MLDRFDVCLAFTLREEGGYADDPADPGGATNMGITLATYRQWSDDPGLGPAQIQTMTERTARVIYRSLYWNPLRADALAAGVDLSVFDMGVNAGIWGSARLLQRALGFTGEQVDGCIGPETLDAAAKCDPRALVDDLAGRQAAYYRSLSDFPTFGAAWLKRTAARRSAALAMITDDDQPEPAKS
jgi:lysozyme family protein